VGLGAAGDGLSTYLLAENLDLGNSFTLSAWVNLPVGTRDIQTLWASKTGGWNTAGVAFYINSYQSNDGRLLLETGNGTVGLTASSTAQAVTPGSWHRVAATVDKPTGSARLYVDGQDVTESAGIRADFISQSTWNLGRFAEGGFYFQGGLDEVRIESEKRSANWQWASWSTVATNSLLQRHSGVVRQQPELSLGVHDGGLVLDWPGNGVGFRLATATNLAAPIEWLPATNPATLVDHRWQVRLAPASEFTRYFRLQELP
jgi:hypothetical protein